ncbi:MAG: Multiple sugar transport system substrate-binding protein [Friedmanniella sp.]|nr:Multiple sugar transport system substrate-binding protein [Friedmanniella sp.]
MPKPDSHRAQPKGGVLPSLGRIHGRVSMTVVRPAGRLALIGVAVGAALLSSACGGSSSSSPGTTASAPASDLNERGPITFARAKDNSGYAPEEIATWNAQHPDEQVTLLTLPDSADQQRQQIIQNAIIKSDNMSVMTTDVVWTAEFAAKGYIEALPADKFPTTDFLPAAVKSATYFDKLYAVPGDSNGGLLFYRKDLLEKAGVKAPTTWDDMKKACKAVQALPGSEKIDCYGGQFDKYEGLTVNFAEAVDSSGGSILGPDGKPSLTTPEAAKGLDFLAGSFKDGTIPAAATTWKEEEGRQAFQKGQLVFLRNWPYVYGLANKTDGSSKVAGKFDVAPLPGLTGPGVSSLGGLNYALNPYAKNKGTAIDFMKFLASEKEQKARSLASANPPTITSLYTDADMVKKAPYLPTLLESIKNANPRPQAVQYGDVTLAIQDSAYAAVQGQQSSEAALATLQAKLTTLTTK